jgi:hypothetical protein
VGGGVSNMPIAIVRERMCRRGAEERGDVEGRGDADQLIDHLYHDTRLSLPPRWWVGG